MTSAKKILYAYVPGNELQRLRKENNFLDVNVCYESPLRALLDTPSKSYDSEGLITPECLDAIASVSTKKLPRSHVKEDNSYGFYIQKLPIGSFIFHELPEALDQAHIWSLTTLSYDLWFFNLPDVGCKEITRDMLEFLVLHGYDRLQRGRLLIANNFNVVNLGPAPKEEDKRFFKKYFEED